MTARHFILATAGHVDHGKSSLVKALTGTDPDRLPEEKARGITIDLGFAHLELPGKKDPQATFHLGIVDVPGHEDFVKNMVAGVTAIDLALLIVAADDGWMPQTEEHLQILSYLGVQRAIVALTKIDLATSEAAIQTEIREHLANSPFANAPIIPVSVVSGRGLNELKSTVAEILEETPAPRNIGKPRLSVDRVFMLRGIGMVVTGTATGGEFRRGEEVVIQPSGVRARIRTIQNHSREVEVSQPGSRTALNLPDVKGAGSGPAIQRGDVITIPAFGDSGVEMDVLLEKSSRLANLSTPAVRPLKDGTRVRVHLGSRNVPAHVILLGNKNLENGSRSLARLRFETPVFAFVSDRFIVRDWSEQATLCGGVVLDAQPPAEKLQSPTRRSFLEARAQAPDSLAVLLKSHIQRQCAVPQSELLLKCRFSAAEIDHGVQHLAKEGQVRIAGNWIADSTWWERLRSEASAKIDEEHRTHPNRSGLSLSELKAAVEKELPAAELFQVLLNELCRDGFTLTGAVIRRSTHKLALPPELQKAGVKVRATLSEKPLDPPSRKAVAPDVQTQQALKFLLETGEAVLLADDVVLLTDAFSRARELVKRFLKEKNSATAGELRQALGTSRRVIIPLLEQLDKEGVTRRMGDKRLLC